MVALIMAADQFYGSVPNALDGTKSFDPDNLEGEWAYSWACTEQCEKLGLPTGVIGSEAKYSTEASSFTRITAEGELAAITLTVTKNGRSSSKTHRFSLVDVAIPIVKIIQLSVAKVNPQADLTLSANISSFSTIVWSQTTEFKATLSSPNF